MSFSRIDGAVLHWRASGPADAPAVVFINSLGSDFRIWDGVAPPDLRLIRYDKRGHGLSDTAPGAFGIDDHARDLAALLDHAGVTSCALVGASVGGAIALRLATRRPERVRALVLCGTATRIGPPELWDTRIAAVRAAGIASIADAVMQRWFSRGFREQRPDEVAGWRNMLVRTPTEGYVATCEAIRDADLTDDARAVGVPCLCVVGDEDGSTPPELVRQTAALIPGTRFEVIEGAGHLPCIERPERLASLIRRHLHEAGHG